MKRKEWIVYTANFPHWRFGWVYRQPFFALLAVGPFRIGKWSLR